MIDGKKITIVVPVYNKENEIETTLKFIKKQKSDEWCCIIIDDDSTDNSSSVIRELIKDDDRFEYYKIFHKGKKNPWNARNVGLSMVRTPYVLFFDADDWINDGYVMRGLKFLEETPKYDLYYESYRDVNKTNGRIEIPFVRYDGNILADFKSYNSDNDYLSMLENVFNIPNICSILKTDIAKNTLFRDEYFEDCDFMLRYLYGFRYFKYVKDEVMYYYMIDNIDVNKVNYNMFREMNDKTNLSFIDYVKEYYIKDIIKRIKEDEK